MHPAARPRFNALGASSISLVFLMVAAFASSAGIASAATTPTGLGQLLAQKSLTANVRGIAEFSAVPTASQVSALKGLGLLVQPMQKVRLALVYGAVSAMKQAVNSGVALDVYPDTPIQLLDTASSNAMGGAAASLRQAGYDGHGVTVAVVDSGCDASHPDLANRVKHNVSIISGEYLNQTPTADNTIVVANETGPYQNTDLGSGHGTHVAGIIAADGTTGAEHLGVAPQADLACFAIGQVLFTTAVVTAYDVMMRQPDMWGIKVVNNSWGNSYRQFDPNDPVSVVTNAVSSLGATVVFASGNSGPTEMSLNPFSEAPWVISVGAGTVPSADKPNKALASFSSTGLIQDNSSPTLIGAGGHTSYTGDRIGVYHPDVVAPGDNISSTCDTAGTVVGPCPPGENTTASGTSMASPHVAGAAAVLLSANPNLTPNGVRLALQATAVPMVDANSNALPFWQQGYGYVDLGKAVALVRKSGWATALSTAAKKADQRVLASDGYKVTRSDWWTYGAPRLAAAGATDSHTYSVSVPSTTKFLKISLAHPSASAVGINLMEYDVTVKDASGKVIGTTTDGLAQSTGTASAFIDLSKVTGGVKFGAFTVDVVGQSAASDPDTLDSDSALGRMITLQVAQVISG
jgi:serine protease AprX